MSGYEKLTNVITTVSNDRMATSFTKNGENYFVSTVKGAKGDVKYQTIIKQAFTHPNSFIVFLITTDCINAAMNHIALVVMADVLDKSEWGETETKRFFPHQQKNELDKHVSGMLKIHRFDDSYIKSLITLCNLNIKQKSKLKSIFLLCIFLLVIYFIFS